MGVGKLAADVAGGIVTKKAMDKVLDNEGEDKSFVKSAAGVGAGLVAAKVIDDTIDKRKEAKEQEGEKQGLGFVKSAALGAGAGFAATTLLHNKDDIKKMTQQDVKDTSMLERANPFAQQQPQLETGINQQFQNSSFMEAIQQQQGNLQQAVDGKGMNEQAAETGQEFSV